MTPTEKHRETARKLAINLNSFASREDINAIAAALANAESEGMKRAAEIARKRIVGGHMHGSPEWPDGDDIATAILSEAGEGE